MVLKCGENMSYTPFSVPHFMLLYASCREPVELKGPTAKLQMFSERCRVLVWIRGTVDLGMVSH